MNAIRKIKEIIDKASPAVDSNWSNAKSNW